MVTEGQICDPDNISDADAASASSQALVCQATSVTQTVLVPGSFQNAMKGDVILSPGGDGADQVIGALLRALDPPQYHSHSGIMTKNFVEITHCTASADRLTDSDYLVGPEGSGGIQPSVLEYAWPGSITQSIDAATHGEVWRDPNNKPFTIGGFTPEALGITSNDHFILVPPLVVKPLPENEEAARPTLRQVADFARSKGAAIDAQGNVTHYGGYYYCFYGYTKPEISLNSGAAASSSDPYASWARGLSPAVCSSFVWLCMKANNVHLVTANQYETPSDLSAAAVNSGAEVGAGTLDGLFYYSRAERQAAAQILDQIFVNAVDQHGGFWPFDTNIADEIMNMFAFNNPNMYGSNQWLTSNDANAVSPDNILWWKQPMFGYAEPLQYLEQHNEQYTVSRWTQVISLGTISGQVTQGGSPVPGAQVYANDSLRAVTDANGNYQITNVAIGPYTMKASAVIGGFEYRAASSIDLTAADPNLTVNIALESLSANYRLLDLVYQLTAGHWDLNAFHDQTMHSAGPEEQFVPLNPGQVTNSATYDYVYADNLYAIRYRFDLVLAADLSIECTITPTIYAAGGNPQQGVVGRSIQFNVAKDGQYVRELDMTDSGVGYTNGPTTFTGTATNKRNMS
jgi:hypothetical protein